MSSPSVPQHLQQVRQIQLENVRFDQALRSGEITQAQHDIVMAHQRQKEILALPAEQKPVEYLTPLEIRDQLERNSLRRQRIHFDMWSAAIVLDQRRRFGEEYTV